MKYEKDTNEKTPPVTLAPCQSMRNVERYLEGIEEKVALISICQQRKKMLRENRETPAAHLDVKRKKLLNRDVYREIQGRRCEPGITPN